MYLILSHDSSLKYIYNKYSKKQLARAHISVGFTWKGFSFKKEGCSLLGPWHSWGRQKFLRLTPKPDPLTYDCLFLLPDCFSACKTTQELPVTQLARHVDLFHLVITDNQRPETLSLPHGLAPPIKPTTQFSQAASL
jgi:hypothetical protein